jgi:nitrogenase molybdenum-iron protein alpha/beta subunit
MSDKEEYIRRLDKIERDLEWIIQYLSKKDVPVQPSPDPNYWAQTICKKCGMNWSGVMGYVCASQDCPMQFKATWQKMAYY